MLLVDNGAFNSKIQITFAWNSFLSFTGLTKNLLNYQTYHLAYPSHHHVASFCNNSLVSPLPFCKAQLRDEAGVY